MIEHLAAGVAPRREARARALDVVLPGLVNAHVHLDLGELAAAPRDFDAWLRAVIGSRAARPPEELARENVATALGRGTTAFGDIDGTGAAAAVVREAGAAARVYVELLGFDLGPEAAASRVAAALQEQSAGRVAPGLSPHAPYSVSGHLLRAARASGAALAIHASETEDEVRFVREGTGPFRGLLEDLGKWDGTFEPPGCSPLAWLERQGCVGPDVLLVHMQILEPGDLEILARTRSPVVVCPGTVQWFDRPAPRVEDLLAAGVTVALGTDSLASNTTLDMFGEMARLRQLCPRIAPDTALAMATSAAGRALGLASGRLDAGLPFDAIALAEPPSLAAGALSEWVTAGEPNPRSVFLGGRTRERPTL